MHVVLEPNLGSLTFILICRCNVSLSIVSLSYLSIPIRGVVWFVHAIFVAVSHFSGAFCFTRILSLSLILYYWKPIFYCTKGGSIEMIVSPLENHYTRKNITGLCNGNFVKIKFSKISWRVWQSRAATHAMRRRQIPMILCEGMIFSSTFFFQQTRKLFNGRHIWRK